MAELYLCEHDDQNQRYGNITKTLEDFFKRKQLNPKSLVWPSDPGAEHGYYSVKKHSFVLDFATIKKPSIVLNNHGFFHGRTYFLVKQFNENLGYVHIDAHPDGCDHDYDMIKGSNFVNHILRLSNVQEVSLIGPTYNTIRECLGWYDGGESEGMGNFNESPTDVIMDSRTKFFLGKGAKTKSIKKDIYDEPNHLKKLKQIIESFSSKYLELGDFNPEKMVSDNVYVSVDMDAIRDFPSTWKESGVLSLTDVLEVINCIGHKKRIVGADICGLTLLHDNEKQIKWDEVNLGLDSIFQVYTALSRSMGK